MKKFDVYTGSVRTHNGIVTEHDDVFDGAVCAGSFDTYEEAKRFYDGIDAEAHKVVGGYDNDVKWIEEAEHNDDEVSGEKIIDMECNHFRYIHKKDRDDNDRDGEELSEEEARKLLGDKFNEFSKTSRESEVTVREYRDENGYDCEEIVIRR